MNNSFIHILCINDRQIEVISKQDSDRLRNVFTELNFRIVTKKD